jgi:hypothetical protein
MARVFADGRVHQTAAQAVGEMALARKKKTKRVTKTIADGRFRILCDCVLHMMNTGDWSAATGADFVAAYHVLHCKVYGLPSDMNSRDRKKAQFVAARMIKENFDGDPGEMAAFLRWTWHREADRERWRRENHREGSRITWYAQFSSRLLTDYKVNNVRKEV